MHTRYFLIESEGHLLGVYQMNLDDEALHLHDMESDFKPSLG